jgi:S1-C subfamily serine protease
MKLFCGLCVGLVSLYAAGAPSEPVWGPVPATVETVAARGLDSVVRIDTTRKNKYGRETHSLGAGVAVRPDVIATANHVVAGAVSIVVSNGNGVEATTATVTASDPGNDVALVRITGLVVTPVPLASGPPVLGARLVVIGHPMGYNYSVSSGIVSCTSRDLDGSGYRGFIQTDAAINPGNSGGPALDLHGRLVGIASCTRKDSTGLGFLVPAGAVAKLMGK